MIRAWWQAHEFEFWVAVPVAAVCLAVWVAMVVVDRVKTRRSRGGKV